MVVNPQRLLCPSLSVNLLGLREQKLFNQSPDCTQCNQKAVTECHCGHRKSVHAKTQLMQTWTIFAVIGRKAKAVILFICVW